VRQLQHGNIAPVDLAQASIGPGMAVFSRYSRIMETDGEPMTVRTALQLVSQMLDETLAEQEGEFDGNTRWALAWFEQFAFNDGPFGDAETLSKAKNTAINALAATGIVKTAAGKARLLRVDELPTDWDPATDQNLTVWKMLHHLIGVMNADGETAAATLVRKLGDMAETARDLAYRLYTICERRKRNDEALAYNGLVIAWPELTKLALAERSKAPVKQSEMF
jgi:putative DNA methylase